MRLQKNLWEKQDKTSELQLVQAKLNGLKIFFKKPALATPTKFSLSDCKTQQVQLKWAGQQGASVNEMSDLRSAGRDASSCFVSLNQLVLLSGDGQRPTEGIMGGQQGTTQTRRLQYGDSLQTSASSLPHHTVTPAHLLPPKLCPLPLYSRRPRLTQTEACRPLPYCLHRSRQRFCFIANTQSTVPKLQYSTPATFLLFCSFTNWFLFCFLL